MPGYTDMTDQACSAPRRGCVRTAPQGSHTRCLGPSVLVCGPYLHCFLSPSCRKFTCHLCDRSFTEKWALNNHMKLHTGEKPFKCTWPTCHYSFLTASAMKDHYRTHTGVPRRLPIPGGWAEVDWVDCGNRGIHYPIFIVINGNDVLL